MSDFCTSEQAISALGYLRQAFGGFSIPEQEERAHLRLFGTCTPSELQEAFDELVTVTNRRPSPNEVAQRVKQVRAGHRRQLVHEPWTTPCGPTCPPGCRPSTPQAVKEHLDQIRVECGIRSRL